MTTPASPPPPTWQALIDTDPDLAVWVRSARQAGRSGATGWLAWAFRQPDLRRLVTQAAGRIGAAWEPTWAATRNHLTAVFERARRKRGKAKN